jgi:iron uptake system EfeUOB component EfeO/EfeM
MNAKTLLISATLAAALALTACSAGGGGGGGGQGGGGQKGQESTQKSGGGGGGTDKAKSDPISKGVADMRTQMGDLRSAIDSNDSAKAQKAAKQLDEAWDKIEDKVKAKDRNLYDRIEDPLHAVIAGVKGTPLDKKSLTEQLDKLDGLLDEATGKKGAGGGGGSDVKKIDMSTGVAAMRFHLLSLKAAIGADDTAKAQQFARAMDEVWDKFEADVKKQDKDAYSKAEDAIHALMSGVKQTPLDKKGLTEQITKLDATLAGLTTK